MKTRTFSALLVQARKERGLTQDQACLLIGIADTSTLSKWETSKEIPSEEMTSKIVQAYDEPLLGYVYLHECTELGRMVLPAIVYTELDNLTLRFQKEYDDIKRIQMDMIAIACDCTVEEHEQERWQMVQKEVADLAGVSLPLTIRSFMQNKKPSQDGSLERAYA